MHSAPTMLPPWLDLPKAAKMQFSLMTFIPLEEFLQNSINFSHANGLKGKISENDVLLQEFRQIADKMARNPAFTQDFGSSRGYSALRESWLDPVQFFSRPAKSESRSMAPRRTSRRRPLQQAAARRVKTVQALYAKTRQDGPSAAGKEAEQRRQLLQPPDTDIPISQTGFIYRDYCSYCCHGSGPLPAFPPFSIQ